MRRELIYLIVVGLAIAPLSVLQGADVSERFEGFDADPGWSGSGNQSGANDYGHLAGASHYAGGASPGELGGTMARTGTFTYYADTQLHGAFDTSRMLKMSGRIAVTAPIGDPGADRNILGYLDTDSASPTMLGMRICDPKNSLADWRIRLYSINSAGDAQGSDASIGAEMTVDGNYFFEWAYDPSQGDNGRLKVRITSDTGSIWVGNGDTTESQDETIILDLADGHGTADPAAMFNGFGLGVINTSSNGFTADVYLDDLLYNIFRDPGKASNPSPVNGAIDAPAQTALGWAAGDFAVQHDVYFGVTFADVRDADRGNPLGVLLNQGQTATTFDPPGALDYGQTYYWRIDEVNGAPDHRIFTGEVWSFTVEPFAYRVENIVASDSILGTAGDAQNTVDGSGLNEADEHSINAADMWLATPAGADPVWIQYEFDRVYQLHEMLVWNYNVQFELILGFGLKDVAVEYSSDGVDWSVLGDVEFARGAAAATYSANTTVDFGDVAAKFVRLTAKSGWGATGQLGLSEVRFLYIPSFARQPQPADGASDVEPNTVLNWRTGRGAAAHEVYLGTSEGTLDLVDTVATDSFGPGHLEFGSTYYWKVDAVNESSSPPVWEGDLWSFSTQDFALIEDFEDYNDDDNLIYETWLDGWINGTGSTVGYLEAPFAERTIVNSGRQSMPLKYNNSAAPFYSETDRDLGGLDLDIYGADTLRLFVRGQEDNAPESLYVMLEDVAGSTATTAHPDPTVVVTASWQEWLIPYSEFDGINLNSVRTVVIGVGDRNTPNSSGTGTVFVDDVGFGKASGVE